ncbi:MAG: MFS transporter [Betaproteobacteria bacterium]|nr:MAG: MFS transporter [Betaproteobacteria bacterium]
MLGFATFAALLPELRDAWRLSNAEAGMIGSAFFVGYVATVAYWTALTDRVDGRGVYLAGGLLGAAGSLGFGLLAEGLASAMLFQLLFGAGMAATYMPGLRLLSDRISGPAQSRAVAFYTSFFGIGTGLSLVVAGMSAAAWGWRSAFVLSALGPALAAVLVRLALERVVPANRGAKALHLAMLFPIAAWRRVLAIRAAAGYTLGYAVHCVELFGSRAWMVAFLAFAAGLQPGTHAFPWSAAAMAAVVNIVAVPASIIGNEIALRLGRRRWILTAMLASGVFGIALALAAPLHWAIVLALLTTHAMLVMADSGTLTAGLIGSAPPALRGAAMGFYSLVGFGGGMLGPTLFGVVLDLAGGAGRAAAWAWAYGAVGAGCLAAPLAVRLFGGGRAA